MDDELKDVIDTTETIAIRDEIAFLKSIKIISFIGTTLTYLFAFAGIVAILNGGMSSIYAMFSGIGGAVSLIYAVLIYVITKFITGIGNTLNNIQRFKRIEIVRLTKTSP